MEITKGENAVIFSGSSKIAIPLNSAVSFGSKVGMIEIRNGSFFFEFNHSQVISPVTADRAELFELLTTDYFTPVVVPIEITNPTAISGAIAGETLTAKIQVAGQDVSHDNKFPTASHIEGATSEGLHREVLVTKTGELKTAQQRDVFGAVKTAPPQTLVDHTRIFVEMIPLFWSDYKTGGATITHNKATSSSTLSVGVNEKAGHQLKARVKYQPGKAHGWLVTGTTVPQTGVHKWVGLGDLDSYGNPTVDGTPYNGVFLRIGETSSDIEIEIYKEHVKSQSIPRSQWTDKLDGTGASGITLDLTHSEIYGGELEWLGVGSVRIALNIKGENVLIYQIDNANYISSGVYMRTANLSPVYLIKSVGGSGSMEAICSTVISGGGHNPTGKPDSIQSYATRADSIAVENGSFEALLFMRLKADSYEAMVKIKDLQVLTTTGADSAVKLLFNPTWAGNALTWVDNPRSHVQYARANGTQVITDPGDIMYTGLFSQTNNEITAPQDSKLMLGKNLQDNANQEGRYDIICLAVRNMTNQTEQYYGAINFENIL